MKKFEFRLNRVRDWRILQLRMEQLKLQQLQAEIVSLQDRKETIQRERALALTQTQRAGGILGYELAAMEKYRIAASAKAAQFDKEMAAIHGLIQSQMTALTERRRAVRALENLEAESRREWHAALDREIQIESDELALRARL